MATRTMPSLLAMLLALLSATRLVAQEAPAGILFERDIVYGKTADTPLKLDLSRPKNPPAAALPCVVVIHGGGWGAGDKRQHDDLTWKFASQGYVSATVGYRLAPAHRFPAQVNDVKCAVRFLRAHSEQYGIDPKRIGAIGFSAGGHLSMMLGTTTAADGLEGDGGWPDQPSQVQAVVSYFGPTDLAAADIPVTVTDILTRFIGGTKHEKPEAFKQASPLTHVSPGDAPMLLFQGTKDPLVPHTQTYPMLEAMTRHNIAGRVELLVGAGHGWGGNDLNRTARESFAFFDEHLKSKSTAAAVAPRPEGAPASARR